MAYFSSIAELAISASRSPAAANPATGSMTYFDSVAFLTMFLLIGECGQSLLCLFTLIVLSRAFY